MSVEGLRGCELEGLRTSAPSVEAWRKLFRVTVGATDTIAVVGRYVVTDSAVEFRPTFPFDAGRSYRVRFDRWRLPNTSVTTPFDTAVAAIVTLPSKPHTPPTTVLRIFPTGDVVPENQLRMYIEFSAPMSAQGSARFAKLLDEDGREVPDAFVPIDGDFWNRDRTRYTLFFDPGRVKRGILPNRTLGRAMRSGHRYTLAIDSGWQDAEGRPLAAPFRHRFRAGPPDQSAIALDTWTVRPPRAGTRDTLLITFPEPLDYGLVRRTLAIAGSNNRWLVGDVGVRHAETEWTFTPRKMWDAGIYQVVVLSILEDLAGNRVGRTFEIDRARSASMKTLPKAYMLPFTVR